MEPLISSAHEQFRQHGAGYFEGTFFSVEGRAEIQWGDSNISKNSFILDLRSTDDGPETLKVKGNLIKS